MRVGRICAHIYAENERSVRLAAKMGFVDSGKTECEVFRGVSYPHMIYELNFSASR